MGMIRAALALTLVAGGARAGDAGYFRCQGAMPDWALTIDGQSARLKLGSREMAMTVDVATRAEGRDFPRAAALLAGPEHGYDTAIILLDAGACGTGSETWPMRGHLLTQIGNRAALVTGCCRRAE